MQLYYPERVTLTISAPATQLFVIDSKVQSCMFVSAFEQFRYSPETERRKNTDIRQYGYSVSVKSKNTRDKGEIKY
jgi:hypothetical protein